MGSTIAEVVPTAIAVLLVNPLPIMAVILMLFSPRATSTAPAFVAGWVIGLIAVFALLLFVVPLDNIAGAESNPSRLASIIRLLLGAMLLFLAFQRWRGRPKLGEVKSLPSWVESLERATPVKALGLGAMFSGLNPKNLAFTIAAAIAIAQEDLTTGQTMIPVAIFVLLASVGVAAPVIWYGVARESASKTLAGWRVWLTANYNTMMAIVFLLFGVIVFTKGLGGLIG